MVAYEVAGHVHDDDLRNTEEFAEVHGGLLNGAVALRCVRERVPDVNLDQVFVAGHSSAADVALLVAAHHPELAGAATYNSAGEGCWFQAPELLALVSVVGEEVVHMCQTTRAARLEGW